MADEKDRLGDKLRDKERAEEDRYFNQRDEALLEKLRKQKVGAAEPAASPKCGGLWFDKGELETVAKREKDSWLGRLVFGPRK